MIGTTVIVTVTVVLCFGISEFVFRSLFFNAIFIVSTRRHFLQTKFFLLSYSELIYFFSGYDKENEHNDGYIDSICVCLIIATILWHHVAIIYLHEENLNYVRLLS